MRKLRLSAVKNWPEVIHRFTDGAGTEAQSPTPTAPCQAVHFILEVFIPHVLPLVDPHLYPSLTTIRAELTLHVFLEAFLDNPVTTESSLPVLISILHYCNQKHNSDFFFFSCLQDHKRLQGRRESRTGPGIKGTVWVGKREKERHPQQKKSQRCGNGQGWLFGLGRRSYRWKTLRKSYWLNWKRGRNGNQQCLEANAVTTGTDLLCVYWGPSYLPWSHLTDGGLSRPMGKGAEEPSGKAIRAR